LNILLTDRVQTVIIMTISQSNSGRFEQFRNGSAEAFTFYVDLHYPSIFIFLLGKARNQAVALDLTQDTFVVLYENRANINDEEHLTCFLYLCARRLFYAHQRGQKALKRMKKELAYATKEVCSILNDLEIISNELLVKHYAMLAFQALPEQKQRIVRLYYFENLTVKEIAARLGIREQTVLNHRSQSIRIMRDYLITLFGKINPLFP
jgi:RNA polymerase sigma factor (sigma-70 family)